MDRRSPWRSIIALIAAACLSYAIVPGAKAQIAGPPGADADPLTFTRDIAPMLLVHCAGCHQPGGGAPFNLLTYADARSRAAQIVDVTARRYMPPWKPEPGQGEFDRVRRLQDSELERLRRWVAGGALEGAKGDVPAPPRRAGWQLGAPDLIVEMPPFILGSDGPDVFRTFVVPLPTTLRRFVSAVEFQPGAPRAVHHANLKIDRTRSSRRLDDEDAEPGFDGGSGRDARFPDGHFLGWTPGQVPHDFADAAWILEPGSDLVAELHMTPTGKPEPVQVRVGLYFSERPPLRRPSMLRLGRQSLDIPAGAARYVSTDRYVLPVDVEVLRIQPHAHQLAREIRAWALRPDGAKLWLINITDWDFRWQDVYRYRAPVPLPAGTTIAMEVVYDNSAGNIRNPNRPPRRVTFGQTAASEMGDVWLQVVARGEGERDRLEHDYAPKMLQEDIAGVEKGLELNPGDARLRVDLALCYIAAGRSADAAAQLREAVRRDPASAAAQYELGTLLLNEGQLEAAATHLQQAVALKPAFADAYNNLGSARYLQGDADRAAAAYERAVALDAGHAAARYNFGRALEARGDRGRALEAYRAALALDAGQAEAHSRAASLQAVTGNLDEALRHYREALAIDPDLPGALADLAWILATTRRADVRNPLEAVRLAERVARITRRENASVLDTLAAAYFASGRRPDAILAARAALAVAERTGEQRLAERIRHRLDEYLLEP